MEKEQIICPYCESRAEYVDSSEVYGTSYGMLYLCRPCQAYVGVHKGTDIPLGSLANAQLRKARIKAHACFDPIAKTGLINTIWKTYIPQISNRNKAYLWLSHQMGIDKEKCHIALFDLEQCQQVISICEKATIHLKSL